MHRSGGDFAVFIARLFTPKAWNSIAAGNAHGYVNFDYSDPEGVEHQSDPFRVAWLFGCRFRWRCHRLLNSFASRTR